MALHNGGSNNTGASTVDKFIPELWSGRLISNLQKAMVYGDLANRDYEGEISGSGDTVHVQNIGRIALQNYQRNGKLTAPQTLSDGQVTLTITESIAFNFSVDDIDKAQTKGSLMEEAMKEAAYSLADDADTFIASLYPNVTAGTAATVTKDSFYEALVAIRKQFRKANVPINELVTVIDPDLEALILQDARLLHATASGDSVLRNGEIGRLAGHTLRVSNNVPVATGVRQVMTFAGKQGISFADQIAKTEAYRPQDSFSDAVKGLHVYGAGVMRKDFVICSPLTLA